MSVGLGYMAAEVFRAGEGAPRMLLLTNQFHDSFKCLIFLCPIGGQRLLRCFRDLIKRRLPANSTVCQRSPYLSGPYRRAFFEKIFLCKWGHKTEESGLQVNSFV